ncbi:transcription repressor NadR [Fredinandcohnia quinoae]|uniref:Transcription repressor NadR n=1 Tax=Fredinandcohnia quinoae TaxID=2918902 RepID=A0AAW5DYJ0_9BACI|nr:transcription repressor NadR [Fredinandcohnia sp. SECRCQ15]MCH1625710.1 transcription repressor NadR [Fredinandcohnia sp. SECRCQ15]
MEEDKKLLGEKRRESIIKWLKESPTPIIGEELSKKANVSRQVIVQDISLLKARNEPIVATSQGYIYLQNQAKNELFTRMIPCIHRPEDAMRELQILVDNGVLVKDVIVEHPVYGEISASLMISSRLEVNRFIEQISTTKASYLSQLTEGVHLHTIEADTIEKLDAACEALDAANFLLKEK